MVAPFIVAVFSSSKARSGHAAFLVFLIAVLVGFAVYVRQRDRSTSVAATRSAERVRPLQIIKAGKREFLSAGPGAFESACFAGVDQVIIPLWGTHIGLEPRQVFIIYGISSLLDMSLFYPAGIASDRFGRKAVVLCRAVFVVVVDRPFGRAADSHLYDASPCLADRRIWQWTWKRHRDDPWGRSGAGGRTRFIFLSVWRLVADAGTTLGPLAIGGFTAVASLGVATPAWSAVLGLAVLRLLSMMDGGCSPQPTGTCSFEFVKEVRSGVA